MENHSWTPADLAWSSLGTVLGRQPVQGPDRMLSRDYASLLEDYQRDLLTSPLQWGRRDWLLTGGLTSLIAGASAFDDGTVGGGTIVNLHQSTGEIALRLTSFFEGQVGGLALSKNF